MSVSVREPVLGAHHAVHERWRYPHVAGNVLDAGGDLFMSSMNHGPLLGVAQVTTRALHDVTRLGVGVATLGTREAPCRRREVAAVAAFVAPVYGRVRSQIADAVVRVVPYRFEGLGVLLDNGVLAVVNEPAGCQWCVLSFEVKLVERRGGLAHVVVE